MIQDLRDMKKEQRDAQEITTSTAPPQTPCLLTKKEQRDAQEIMTQTISRGTNTPFTKKEQRDAQEITTRLRVGRR